VLPDLAAETRDEILAELVEAVADEIPADKDELVAILIERENQASTALSEGAAVPHGRIEQLERFIMAVGRSKKGIPFGAEDGDTNIFFFLMAPKRDTGAHLKALARIARVLRREGVKQDIIKAKTAADIYERIIEEDEKI